ncbi:ABC transporter-associated protein EcsC [Sutcliffiella horikoshii]|uniref:ABC transporter-associated protein EcsC n=2 Tax=Sutcliffiella horikoshii TaxID=79883 RepID=A0A1Y0CUF7_9BACI|nr:ABC transporter-associated protein EcsC [Sutcliffiella horikoshii]TYS61710.1 EcsC family protein [Sutcliffiella horikoshii]
MDETRRWKMQVAKKSTMFQRFSKGAQNKVNAIIPEKVHTIMTESIKKMVQGTLVGSNMTTKMNDGHVVMSLEEKEKWIQEKLNVYKKTAAVEGAGTGAGGILLGLADFPLLLSIKMKFLFEVAAIYGFNTKNYEERVFILYIFQLAFSSDSRRKEVLRYIENWEEHKEEAKELDWKAFQQEYRDHIDLIKMLQMIPGVGAVVGAYANYNFLDQLGTTAINCYRLRMFKEKGINI